MRAADPTVSRPPTDRLVSVAVPVAVDRAFTYRLEEGMARPQPGVRVLVPFGNRALVGVVRPGDPQAEPGIDLKPIFDVLDAGVPSLPPDVVELCEWMSDYYVAPIGEVYRLATPGLLSNADARRAVVTEQGVQAHGAVDAPLLGGPRPELATVPAKRLLAALVEAGKGGLEVSKLARLRPRIRAVLAELGRLEDAGLCETEWVDEVAPSRMEIHLRRTDYLRGSTSNEAELQRILGRSKQRRALLDYLEGQEDAAGWVSLSELRGPFPRVRQLMKALVDADVVAMAERPKELDPFDSESDAGADVQEPTADQAAALTALAKSQGAFTTSLLHGITGSGKTEVYLQHIASIRARGEGAIVLVPEIALTPQLSDRFRARFEGEVAVLHSGLTPRQRLDAWQQIRTGERPIVIGARSAIFAPVPRLRVIVVDEEHDGSFKQEEGVRYNARDVAIVRARTLGASVILGSATPSLESYSRAQSGHYAYLCLRQRPTPRPLPKVEIIPLSVHRPDPESLLTGVLRHAIKQVVDAKEQAILFLNRRGYTTSLICEACGSFQQCPDCSAPSMTYHLARNRLMCHLCGYLEATPQTCRECGGSELSHGGTGTERVEVALSRALDGVRVLRLDRDAARGRALLRTLAAFRRREADVLVGTQMLSKGHDFPGVTLVGILQGDHGLAMPDVRASERTFQLLTQVAGRAGRGAKAGRVLVQAYNVEHPAIAFAAEHDYSGFAEQELEGRARMGNPPSGFLTLVRVHGLAGDAVEARARTLASFLAEGLGKLTRAAKGKPPVDLLGPMASPIAKINRRTRWQMLLRARDRSALRWVLRHLRGQLGVVGSGALQTIAVADVDPQSLL